MTQQEIFERIQKNNSIIQKSMNPAVFELNQVVAELLAENRQLQNQCQHEFVNDVCKWCLYQK